MQAYQYGKNISKLITQLDAYYLGLLEQAPGDVIKYKLGTTDFPH